MNDFGAGVYFAEPHDARGADLVREGRDRFARPENQKFFEEISKTVEAETKTNT